MVTESCKGGSSGEPTEAAVCLHALWLTGATLAAYLATHLHQLLLQLRHLSTRCCLGGGDRLRHKAGLQAGQA